MTRFAYTAIPARFGAGAPANGSAGAQRAAGAAGVIAGRLEASDESSLRARLREQGLIPIEVRPVSPFDAWRAAVRGGRLRGADSAWFFQTLHRLLRGKAPVEVAVTTMQELAPRPPLAQACGQVRDALRSGSSLADAVERVHGLADAQTLALLRVGHESGRLEHAVELIDRSAGQRRKIRKTLVTKLTYPAMVFVVACVAVCVLAWFVIPGFAETLKSAGAGLPLSTRITLAASKWIVWIVPAAIALGVALAATRAAVVPPGARAWMHRTALRAPVIGPLVWHGQAAIVADTLATIVEGGGDVLVGMEQAERALSSPVLRERLRGARQAVREGQDLGEALATRGVMPPMVSVVVRVGMKSGDLVGSLRRATDMCMERQEELVQRLLTFVEPGIIVFLAGVVGWVFYSLVAGILTINDLGVTG